MSFTNVCSFVISREKSEKNYKIGLICIDIMDYCHSFCIIVWCTSDFLLEGLLASDLREKELSSSSALIRKGTFGATVYPGGLPSVL